MEVERKIIKGMKRSSLLTALTNIFKNIYDRYMLPKPLLQNTSHILYTTNSNTTTPFVPHRCWYLLIKKALEVLW